MEEKLKAHLNRYGMITKNIIDTLQKDEFDDLNELFLERQQVIENINMLNYSSDEFKILCSDYEILVLEEELQKILNEKKNYVRTQIDKLSGYKNAKNNYTKKFSLDSIYFNKKI